ncbi:MAG TPA: glycoside hydrolase family 2 TIM barrel-domain containing protein [Ilumatobacteraceae bacterium]|nr:glycoside hydrolase family 2 TIM barrel-domain containing protein [Ilumatobacteraceae bacterium]
MTSDASGVAVEPDRFRLGCNYWPRNKAMSWWSDFDAGEVGDEFDAIAGLGMDCVRLFLLWDDWMPSPDTVSTRCLGDLGRVCDAAADRGLVLDVTFFTGHMSGPNWSPGWLLAPDGESPTPNPRQVVSGGRVVAGSYRNPFHDPEAIAAERLLITTVVGAYRDHPAIWMWNLGNEPDLFAWPSSAAAGRAWVRDMRSFVGEIDADHPVTCGLHVESLVFDNHLRVDDVFAETDVAVMHGYPMYASWARDPLDTDFVPFLCALTSALCAKPVLAEEWGGCTVPGGGPSQTWEWIDHTGAARSQFMAGEDTLAEHVAAVLPKLVDVGATGALLWCFADYAEHLWDRPPCDPRGAIHERHFGLVRPDGTLKPHAEALRRFAATRAVVQPPRRTVELGISGDQYYADPLGWARRLYDEFVEPST